MKFLSRLFSKNKEPAEIKDIALTSPKTEEFKIPPDVLELLWMSDGPYANYTPHKTCTTEDNRGYRDVVNRMNSLLVEPSCISIKMPVKEPSNRLFLPPLSYYPQYSQLTSEQRWRYLTWLRDVTVPIDIGYVFLFYYGLECHLFMGKFQSAFKMIVKLRKHQFNTSFEGYSNNSMLASMIYHRDFSLYDLFESVQRESSPITTLQVVAKYQSNTPLTASEIMRLSNMAGYVNKRYMNAYPDIFLEELEQILIARYGASSLPWGTMDLSETPAASIQYMANFSLPLTMLQILDIPRNNVFRNTVRGILLETHEVVKARLRRERSEQQKKYSER